MAFWYQETTVSFAEDWKCLTTAASNGGKIGAIDNENQTFRGLTVNQTAAAGYFQQWFDHFWPIYDTYFTL